MGHKTVLKVDVSCDRCKKKLLKAVSGLPGVDKVEVDGAKGLLSVTGDADPYKIIVRTRKTGLLTEVVSIGPPPVPPKQDGQKKGDEKKSQQAEQIHGPYYSYPTPIIYMSRPQEPNPQCIIL